MSSKGSIDTAVPFTETTISPGLRPVSCKAGSKISLIVASEPASLWSIESPRFPGSGQVCYIDRCKIVNRFVSFPWFAIDGAGIEHLHLGKDFAAVLR